ncbi:DUF2282 domain-containing protein [Massilia sp. ST3]|uniref:BufA1 family periplasmic bufferin-type metallophore n=1 Tax=Massilia sp. ST3 TaxID=2824903 RepID=UPI001B829E51|nr:DUF2282 domain-containing protein [Massilia sp. ST3]MBQ5949000.1 DUF2282 domain-containing protein [Massilia sp. ST3]
MSHRHALIAAALAGVCAASSLTAAQAAGQAEMGAPKADQEMCYGVAKAGQNDCGTATHGCMGAAVTDNDPAEWKFVAKGSCAKLGGSLKPGAKADKAADPATPAAPETLKSAETR